MITEEHLLEEAVSLANGSKNFANLVDESVYSIRIGLHSMYDAMCPRLPCLTRGYLHFYGKYPLYENQFTLATTLHVEYLLDKIVKLEEEIKSLKEQIGVTDGNNN